LRRYFLFTLVQHVPTTQLVPTVNKARQFGSAWLSSLKSPIIGLTSLYRSVFACVCVRVTHISVLVDGGSGPVVHVFDVIGWTDDHGGASIYDSLTTTIASHGVAVDGNTGRTNISWI
jgi:hypothetical protein